MKGQRLVPLLVVAAGLLAWHNSLRGPFIFDDLTSISENPHIRHLWPIGEAVSAPAASTVNGRPVVCLSLALNYALGGSSVWGYHALNLAVHLLSALVLFGILRTTFAGEKLRDRFGGAAMGLAAGSTLLWEVHPLQTESVTYVVQRTESLMGLFLLLTLYCTLRCSRSSHAGGWCLAAIVSCALGMGSKEVMVAAPLLVLLYDRVFLASSFREIRQRRIGLYIGLAASWLILAVLVARTPHARTGLGIEGLTPWTYLKTEAGVIVYYLRLCFWPHPLVIDYYDWPIVRSLEDSLVPGVVLVGLLSATAWAFRRQPQIGFLGAWFFLILGPTSSFLPSFGEVAAERRMYLPLAAVVTMVVVSAFVLGKPLLKRRLGVVLGCVAGGAVVVLFTFLTIQRNRDYTSEVTIWQDTVENRPNNPRAHCNLGEALFRVGKVDEAVAQFQEALRIQPDLAEAHNNLGTALYQAGKRDQALEHFQQALRIQPGYAEPHNNLGHALLRLGKVPEAIAECAAALRINPDFAEAHYNLGNALFQLGKVDEAVAQYQEALRIKPGYADARRNSGYALLKLGKAQEAIGHLEWSLRTDPDNGETQSKLGAALMIVGKPREAIAHLEHALRVRPDMAEAQNNLAWVLATLPPAQGGDAVRAVGLAQRACELTGNRAAVDLDTLAAAYAAAGRFDDAVNTAQKAIELARPAGQSQLVEDIEARLELYRSGRAYRPVANVAGAANQ